MYPSNVTNFVEIFRSRKQYTRQIEKNLIKNAARLLQKDDRAEYKF